MISPLEVRFVKVSEPVILTEIVFDEKTALGYNGHTMLLQASQLTGLPVGATDTQSRVGTVSRVFIDPDSGQLVGFGVKTGLVGGEKVLSFHDVTGIDHAAVLVRTPEVVLPTEEVAPIKKLLEDKRPVMGQKVVAEGGTSLGKVVDLVVNTETGMATKLYASHLLEERIIPIEKVVKITRDKIVVKDDVVLGRGMVGETMPV